MSEITLDFETSSLAELSDVGSDIYSKHITTEILSLVYTVGDRVRTWVPPTDDFPNDLYMLALDPSHTWICHNAGFEKDIWRNIMVPVHGFPDIPNDRWHDIMASCALRCVGLALDNALRSMGLPGKDVVSSKFTRNLSIPDKKTGMLDRSPASLARVYAYNRDDVVKERELHKRIGYLPSMERKIWLIDQDINERGVKFDIPMVIGAQKIYEAAKQPLIAEFRHLTGINPTQVAKFQDWLGFNGVELANMRKETVNALLGLAEDDNEDMDGGVPEWSAREQTVSDLPDNARRALTIRALVGSSSVKKFARMEQCADPIDWRIRRLLQYHGAGTGRWAGRLFNAHNMPRGLARVDVGGKARSPDPEGLARAITNGSVEAVDALGCFIEYGGNRVTANPIEVLASALRSTMIAEEGKHLLIGDWSSIEPRLSLAFAGQTDKIELLASGVDVYLDMAEQIYKRPKGSLTEADVELRQTGKNTINGCNFQMGDDTFCRRYIPECVCKASTGACLNKKAQPPIAHLAIETYRKEWAPEIPKMWKALQDGALRAVQTCLPVDTGYGLTYVKRDGWLVGVCPDGSELYYFRPTLCRRHMPWSTPEKPDVRPTWRYQVPPGAKANSFGGGESGRWVVAYGGLEMENFIQHMARQLLARALGLCKVNGLPVVLHNQDEIIAEVKNPDRLALKQIMEDRPRWAIAINLPLSAKCHEPCTRYHK